MGKNVRLEFVYIQVIAAIYALGAAAVFAQHLPRENTVKVGWIGPMTGELAKWGGYQAALIAADEVNAPGMPGPHIEIIFEDGKSQGKDAASAAQKLINIDRVKFILGGQCTRESLAIAPIAERAGVIMLAAITSNPFLTEAGDNVFRVTAVSTTASVRLMAFAAKEPSLKSFAVIFEEADYPRPQAEKFRDLVLQNGLSLTAYQGFLPGEHDFRSVLTKLKASKPDAVFIATTSPDFAALLLRQIRDLGINSKLFGNENTGFAVNSSGLDKNIFNGLVFAASRYDAGRPKARVFLEKYRTRWQVDALPYGAYTAEPYDALWLLADTIRRCGSEPAAVKQCLYQTTRYEGASGVLGFDTNGDAIRDYELLVVRNGIVTPFAELQH